MITQHEITSDATVKNATYVKKKKQIKEQFMEVVTSGWRVLERIDAVLDEFIDLKKEHNKQER